MTLLPLITSSHNPFFRKCLQLRESRKRRQSGQFLIDGAVEICRAIAAGLNVERVLSDDQILPSELHELVTSKGILVQEFSSPLLEKLSYGQHSNQPIAVVTTPSLSLHSLNLDSNSLVLVLDRTEKPGNLGACLRSAAAGGASAVVLTDPICDPFNANAIRASRGTMFRVPMAMATASEFIKLAREIQLPLLAARVDATKSLWEINLERGTAMVFGNEAEGLGRDWAGASIDSFTIPMTSKADSLNLSISAAVTLYEAFRQRSRREI
jgi:RNA methyltransferase, TrmH family